MIDLKQSVYLFVHKGYFDRRLDLSEIVRDMKLFYGARLTPELIKYASDVYNSFSDITIIEIDNVNEVEAEYEQLKF